MWKLSQPARIVESRVSMDTVLRYMANTTGFLLFDVSHVEVART